MTTDIDRTANCQGNNQCLTEIQWSMTETHQCLTENHIKSLFDRISKSCIFLSNIDQFRISCHMTSFRIRCIGQSDCCQKRCLTQALNWCLTLETIVSCRIWQILNPRKCHIINSRMVLMEESFLTGKKIRLLQFCDSG